MTSREKFMNALDRKPIKGHVPIFELVYFLTMEKFGKVHPSHRQYNQWGQMSENERKIHRKEMAKLYIDVAEMYQHDAIFLHPNPGDIDEIKRLIYLIREMSGDKYFLMIHGDATFGIPDGNGMYEFCYKMIDEPEKLKAEAKSSVFEALKKAEELKKEGFLDGFALCSDYCFNTGPFISPNQFSEFIMPYLCELIEGYRSMGFYTIKHTDGNIMPILDQLIEANPHGLHSLDPQAGVDIAVVKKMVGDKVCLIGNVNCGLLETGTDEEVMESARYALKNGMPNYGYIFSTSNCVYTRMPPERYDLIWNVWKKEGMYKG